MAESTDYQIKHMTGPVVTVMVTSLFLLLAAPGPAVHASGETRINRHPADRLYKQYQDLHTE
jgi:hypothetical protein